MDPLYNGWKSYTFFFSAENTQAYLKKKYQAQNLDNPSQKGFDNCYAFLYYLEHGQIYYEQSEKAPLILKPILLFYGFVHLIKACILTVNPLYPETTSVLAHGVSTRKRKKQNYQFFHDEVKFQRNGLFPFMSETMFHMEQLEGDKITMEELLKLIPELDELFVKLEAKQTFMTLERCGDYFTIPEKILDHYHMTEGRFKEFFSTKFNSLFFDQDTLKFRLDDKALKNPTPLKFNLEMESYTLPLNKNNLFHFPELLTHYLLLYNLSMIARYETEWWGELIKMMPNRDYPFINSFLNITQKKGPFLIHQFLMG
ncbi:YaaC family protein [Neobacillus sp. PS3-40]|uniref:YaaC family protein n=1 Tax=Neobacillus sp. PS3-40 TaxID=3070679 RepID=UPI0027DFA42B|nr:YaaC family protein [Neobacillus sp. PS3-40]WML42485.1 YaaC family protein [Neobacillus sp. PS3-40]